MGIQCFEPQPYDDSPMLTCPNTPKLFHWEGRIAERSGMPFREVPCQKMGVWTPQMGALPLQEGFGHPKVGGLPLGVLSTPKRRPSKAKGQLFRSILSLKWSSPLLSRSSHFAMRELVHVQGGPGVPFPSPARPEEGIGLGVNPAKVGIQTTSGEVFPHPPS